MKKVIIASMLCFVSIICFAQIQIQSEGQAKTISETNKEASYIEWYEDGFYYKMLDYKCSKFHLNGDKFIVKIFLGKNAKEVQKSGDILQQWFNDAKNEAYINISNPNGQNVCLYKFNANIYASYGNEMNCKATRLLFGADMTSAIVGSGQAGYASKNERDELMANIEFGDYVLTGMCSFKNDLMKSIKNFREPGQVSQKVRQTIMEKINTVKKKVHEAELNESIAAQNYNMVVRTLMSSEKETDWTTIDHMNTIMLELTKSKSRINQAELEEKLSKQEEVSNKIAVFEEYFQNR